MTILVGISALGSLSCHIMTSGQLLFSCLFTFLVSCLFTISCRSTLFCWCSSRPYSRLFILDYCWHLHSKTCSHFLGTKKFFFFKFPKYFHYFSLFLGGSFIGIFMYKWHIRFDQLCLICGIQFHSFINCQSSVPKMETTWFTKTNQSKFTTVWKLQNFSVTQILREIKVSKSRISKSAIYKHWEVLDFHLLWFFALFEG